MTARIARWERLASWPARHPWLALMALAVAVAVATAAAWPLPRLRHPWLSGLAATHPAARAYLEAAKSFDLGDDLIVAIEARETDQEFQLKALAEVLAEAIRDPRYVTGVAWRADQLSITWPYRRDFLDLSPGRSEWDGMLVNYLTPGDWRQIESRLEPAELQLGLARLRARLAGLGASGVPPRDPLGVFAPVRDRLQESLIPAEVVTRDGYFFSRNGEMLVLFARPAQGVEDVAFCEGLIRFLEDTRDALAERTDLFRDVRIHFVGPHAAMAAEYRAMRNDLLRALGIALPLGIALLLFAYRRAFVFVTVPCAVGGTAWMNCCLASAVLGGATPWMLAGLPVGAALALLAAIHLHDRYIHEAPRTPDNLPAALARALRWVMGPVALIGSLVAVLGGQAALSAAAELRSLGVTVAFGGLLAPTVAWLAMGSLTRLLAVPSQRRSISLHFRSFGMRRVAWGAMAFPRAWLALLIMATAYLGYHAPGVHLAIGETASLWTPEEYSRTNERVSRRIRHTGRHFDLVQRAPSLQEVLVKAEALYETLRAQRSEPAGAELVGIVSPRNILPSLASQEASRRRMLALNNATLERRLAEEATEAELNYEAVFGGFLQTLRALATWATERPYTRWGEIRDAGTMEAIRQLIGFDGRSYLALTRVHLSAGQRRPEAAAALISVVTERHPNASLLDRAALSQLNAAALLRGLIAALVPAVLLLWLAFVVWERSAVLGTLSAAVVLLPQWWFFGLARLAAVPLGFPTLVMLLPLATLLAGGVAIFQSRWRGGDFPASAEEGPLGRLYEAAGSNGRPFAVVQLLLLILGMSLLLSDHPHLRAVGSTMVLALTASALSLLALLPCGVMLATGEGSFGGGIAGTDDPKHLYRLSWDMERSA